VQLAFTFVVGPSASSFVLAPGAERHGHATSAAAVAAAQTKTVMSLDYSTDFPKLPDAAPVAIGPAVGKQAQNAWAKPIHSNVVTQVRGVILNS
jgi:hypothetical protein